MRTAIVILLIGIITSCETSEQKLVGNNWRHVFDIDSTEMTLRARRYSHMLTFINDSHVDTKQEHFKITNVENAEERDYGFELVWAYPYLRYLSQKLDLMGADTGKCNLKQPFTWATFEKGDDNATLTQSESFLLSFYLNQAKQVELLSDETLEYKLQTESSLSENENSPEILTNGRYYRVKYKENPHRFFDIGFNFLAANAKILEFKEKE
ncbi:MAG TPA: hypothetical protein VK508_12760 [Cyclobacteriaceae bacterium]|nr:hypothetical protein [Cyclobacteriaceae bacterium]